MIDRAKSLQTYPQNLRRTATATAAAIRVTASMAAKDTQRLRHRHDCLTVAQLSCAWRCAACLSHCRASKRLFLARTVWSSIAKKTQQTPLASAERNITAAAAGESTACTEVAQLWATWPNAQSRSSAPRFVCARRTTRMYAHVCAAARQAQNRPKQQKAGAGPTHGRPG